MNEANQRALDEVFHQAARCKAEVAAAKGRREREMLAFVDEFRDAIREIIAPAFESFAKAVRFRGIEADGFQSVSISHPDLDLLDAPFMRLTFGKRDQSDTFGSIELSVDVVERKVTIVRRLACNQHTTEPEVFRDGSLHALSEDAIHAELRKMLALKLA